MPGFDGGEESLFREVAGADVAGAALRPRVGTAAGEFGAREGAVLGAANQMDALEARGQKDIGSIVVPIDGVDAVNHALIRIGNQSAFPFAWTVVKQGRVAPIVRSFRICGSQRRVDQQAVPHAEAMRRRYFVNVRALPGVAGAFQNRHDSDAALGLRGEFVRQCDGIGSNHGEVDRLVDSIDDYMFLPGWIFVPGDLRQTRRQRD